MKLSPLLLTALLAASPCIATAQTADKVDMKDVTNNLDMDGQFFMANNIEGDLGKLAALGTDFAQNAAKNGKSCLPEDMDFTAVLKDFGLDEMVAYGRSAKFADDHWVSKMYIQNNGSKKGVFSMMGAENTTYQAINFAPSGTDLVMEWSVDTRQLMASMKSMPKCERMDKWMSRKMTDGSTMEDMLNQFTMKMSLAVKLDDKIREVCPVYPEYTFPKLHGCMRMEGANLMWKQVGPMAGFMLKMEKQEDGTLLMTPHKQKKNMNVVMLLDAKNDLLWAATSPEFLIECRNDGAKLAADADFKAISGGSTTGNVIAYISRQACLEIRQVKETKFKKKEKKYLSDDMMKKIMDHLTESKNGYYAEMRKGDKGINFVLKAPCPVKEIIGGKRGYHKGGMKGKGGCPFSGGSKSDKGGCGCEKGKCECDKDKSACKCKGKCECGKAKPAPEDAPKDAPKPADDAKKDGDLGDM